MEKIHALQTVENPAETGAVEDEVAPAKATRRIS